MAIKIVVTDTDALARQDTFRVNPADVRLGLNVSRLIPATDYAEQVKSRALSMATEGQLSPCEARREEDKTLTLTSGFTRRDAAQLIREGFDAADPMTGTVKHFHDPAFTLWIKVVDCTQDEAAVRGIIENQERKDTTDLQEAKAQEHLRSALGWSETQIARLYGYTNLNRVNALCKLLSLPETVQQQVHAGKLALYAALDCLKAKLSPEEMAQVIDGSTNPKGNVEGAVLRTLIRDLLDAKMEAETPKVEDAPAESTATTTTEPDDTDTTHKVKRNVKEFKNWAAEALERELISAPAKEFIAALVNWFDGKRGFGDKKINTLLGEL